MKQQAKQKLIQDQKKVSTKDKQAFYNKQKLAAWMHKVLTFEKTKK